MPRVRRRWMIMAVALVVMVVLALILMGVPAFRDAAVSGSNRPPVPPAYLALGDSVAFGYNPLVSPDDARDFIGYPAPIGVALKERLTNAACPGETSSHFISLSGSDNGCQGYRSLHPLHVAYTTSQLAYADDFLRSHPQTRVVSLDIGSNDLFVLANRCGGEQHPDCIRAGLPGVLTMLSADLDTIYHHLRDLDGYHQTIVALTYYTIDYRDRFGTEVISRVNQVVAERTRAWNGVVADGFAAFKAATAPFGGDTCAAGLLIVMSRTPLTCDIHPAEAGRDLLAATIENALHTG